MRRRGDSGGDEFPQRSARSHEPRRGAEASGENLPRTTGTRPKCLLILIVLGSKVVLSCYTTGISDSRRTRLALDSQAAMLSLMLGNGQEKGMQGARLTSGYQHAMDECSPSRTDFQRMGVC